MWVKDTHFVLIEVGMTRRIDCCLAYALERSPATNIVDGYSNYHYLITMTTISAKTEKKDRDGLEYSQAIRR